MPESDGSIPKPDFSSVAGNKTPRPATGPTTSPAPGPTTSPAPSGPKPDFSNVQSGGSSTAPVLKAELADKFYTVKAGDSLSKIAKHEYGDANLWRQVFEANKDTIQNPDLIHPGQIIKLPAIKKDGNA